jgi:hypothetical protein
VYAEMVVGGILPLHALKDHISPMELLAKRIPRAIFEETYNIVLPSRTQKGEERVYVTWQVYLFFVLTAPLPPPPHMLAPCRWRAWRGHGGDGGAIACGREGMGGYPGGAYPGNPSSSV